MVQGTASSAGKSLLVTALCRIFRQDGFRVAPFKSQNMALNSFITRDGLEMGRAQVAQAEAAGVEPSVLMNPILLKPTGDATSQVVVNGEVVADMRAGEYFRRKASFIPAVRNAYTALASQYDIIVIEGAGSPAEINLRDNDIVNMGMAAIADAPVLLVGDIDRGGVFASLYGTVSLLEPDERARIKGTVINKFRGDVDILRPGLGKLEELTGVPVLGVVPYLHVDIDDEDSVSDRLSAGKGTQPVDVAVIRLPRLSNFTDFISLERQAGIGVRYAGSTRELGSPDCIIIPGTKNSMADLLWLRQNGLEAAIKRHAASGVPILGICGGYQILGRTLADPYGVEHGGTLRGMELLPVDTRYEQEKVRTRVDGTIGKVDGFFSCMAGADFEGYEIHMGQTLVDEDATPFAVIDDGRGPKPDGAQRGNVAGSYVHGLFDSPETAGALTRALLAAKGFTAEMVEQESQAEYKERQYTILADAVRSAIDMEAVYRIMGITRA